MVVVLMLSAWVLTRLTRGRRSSLLYEWIHLPARSTKASATALVKDTNATIGYSALSPGDRRELINTHKDLARALVDNRDFPMQPVALIGVQDLDRIAHLVVKQRRHRVKPRAAPVRRSLRWAHPDGVPPVWRGELVCLRASQPPGVSTDLL